MAGTVAATYNAAGNVPVTASSYAATGNTVSFSLNYAPATGTNLMVVNNTGLPFIQGTFDNLAQGQAVVLSFVGVTYNFVANYYGGNGNDLVLQWANNRLVNWGDNRWGQLNNSGTTYSTVPLAVDQAGLLAGKTVIAVAAGRAHSLVLCSDGTLAAWGNNTYGQLGTTGAANGVVAVDQTGVLAGKTVIAVAAGDYFSLVLCSDGTLAAWGYNGDGELGNNSTTDSRVPVAVSMAGVLSGKMVVAVAAGSYHSLALCSDGTAVAWGYNTSGQLGDGSTTTRDVPVQVNTAGVLHNKIVIAVTAGDAHSLALCADGKLATWGSNAKNQLGNLMPTSMERYSTVPVAVATYEPGMGPTGIFSKTVTAVAAGYGTSLVLCSDGTPAAWGDNAYGELGNRIYPLSWKSYIPVPVTMTGALTGKKVIAVSSGEFHNMALCSDGTLAAWGRNYYGDLGNTTTVDSSVPVAVHTASLAPGEKFTGITCGSAGSHHALAIVSERSVMTAAATAVTSTSSTLNGTVNANGGSLPVSFDYGISLSYGTHMVYPNSPVAGSGAATVSVALTGLAPGTTYHFRVNGGPANGNDMTFTTLPAIATQPVSVLAATGQSASIFVIAIGDALGYQWLKNNVAVSGATQAIYSLAAAATSNAGSYKVKVTNTNAAGPVTSLVANLGVVNVTPAAVAVVIGNTLSLTASAAGPGLSYHWQKNGVPMANGQNSPNSLSTISGVNTAKLIITKPSLTDAADYTCLITMPNPQNPGSPLTLTSGVFTVTITIKPVLNALAPGPWIVSGTVTDGVTAMNTATTFTVKGLPAGMTVNARTGQLGGKPTVAITQATTYNLIITASNAAGASAASRVAVTVEPLPGNAVGTFNGLVDRDDTLSSGHGGTLSITSLNSGVFTGKLTLGPLSYSFTSLHLDAVIGASPSATVTIVRRLPLHNLTLTFALNQGTGELTGAVTDGVIASPVVINAWRNPWNTTSHKAPLAATYCAALFLDQSLTGTGSTPSNVAYPQGTGYGTLTITTAGVATWSGKMADGAVTTCSCTMAANGAVPLHSMLYTGTGSAHGWVIASADSTVTPANRGLRLLDGSVDWMKYRATTSADRTYRAGIPFNILTVIGGEYVKPTTTVLGLKDLGVGTVDAKLVFSEGGLHGPAPIMHAVMAAAPDVSFRITPTNALVMPIPASNPGALSLTLNAATGAFSGSFVLGKDPDPTATQLTLLSRKVYYHGLVIPRLSVNQGLGYFLLPELPADGPPITTLLTSPILSGQVLIEKAP